MIPLKRLEMMMALEGAIGKGKVRVDLRLLSPRMLVADNPKAGHGAGENKDYNQKADQEAFTGHPGSPSCL